MRVITHIYQLSSIRAFFWGCVPTFEQCAWNTLNSFNIMNLQRFFWGVFQEKSKSQLGIGKCALCTIYAVRIGYVYCIIILYTIIINFLEHLEHIGKYQDSERALRVPTFKILLGTHWNTSSQKRKGSAFMGFACVPSSAFSIFHSLYVRCLQKPSPRPEKH